MTTNETYDLDAEILLAANPYRIPTDADLVEAARGCNQYKHKPGCPEAEGGDPMKNMTTKQKYELFRGAWASAVDKNTGKRIRLQITALQADAVARWGVVGVDDGRIWVMNDGNKYFLEDRTLADIAE